MKITSTQLLKYITSYESWFKIVGDNYMTIESKSLCISLKYLIKKFDKVKSKLPGGSGCTVTDWTFDSSHYGELAALNNTNDAANYLSTYVFNATVLNRIGNFLKQLDKDLSSNTGDQSSTLNKILKALIAIYTLLMLSIQVNIGDIQAYEGNNVFRNLCKSFTTFSKNIETPYSWVSSKVQSSPEFKSLLMFSKSLRSTKL